MPITFPITNFVYLWSMFCALELFFTSMQQIFLLHHACGPQDTNTTDVTASVSRLIWMFVNIDEGHCTLSLIETGYVMQHVYC